MEIIIIDPVATQTEGIVECRKKDNLLFVVYSFTTKEKNTVMRLRALSSKKPCNPAVKIDVPIFNRGRAKGKKEISAIELGMAGYMPRDIDTFVLTYDTKKGTDIAAVGFGGLRWDISYQISRKSSEDMENPVYKSGKLLERLKTSDVKDSYKNKIIDALKSLGNNLEKPGECPCPGYEWYRFNSGLYPLNLSIFSHIAENTDCLKGRSASDVILCGIKEGGHVALAVKNEGSNPFLTAEDCVVLREGYWITGVCFKDDGQYFERI